MTRTWTPAPPDLQLEDACVDIWRTRLDLPEADCNALQSLLTTAELERARRFVPRGKFREFVITRGTLRLVLGRLLDRNPAAVPIDYARHDKPRTRETRDGRNITFNVSHSHGQSLIAVALDRPVGIDIERIRADVQYLKLARRFFSMREAAALERLDHTDLPRAFFTCWTRKEAFVKGMGEGIAYGLAGFSVSLDPHRRRVDLTIHGNPGAALEWTLESIDVGTDYCAALAVRGSKLDIRYWDQPGSESANA